MSITPIGDFLDEYKKEEEKLKKEHEKRTSHETKEEILSSEVAKYLINNDKDGAWEYLNARFMEEIIDDCQHQELRDFSLDTVLVKRKNKYAPFYMRIGKTMPENLYSITAEDLCKILEVKNLHVKDNKDSNAPIIPEQTKKETRKGCWKSILYLLATVILFIILALLGVFD
jgi:hypothetical protein